MSNSKPKTRHDLGCRCACHKTYGMGTTCTNCVHSHEIKASDGSWKTIQTLLAEAQSAAIYGLHDSIMRNELELGAETDLAFNYARIHRWLDAQIAAPPTMTAHPTKHHSGRSGDTPRPNTA